MSRPHDTELCVLDSDPGSKPANGFSPTLTEPLGHQRKRSPRALERKFLYRAAFVAAFAAPSRPKTVGEQPPRGVVGRKWGESAKGETGYELQGARVVGLVGYLRPNVERVPPRLPEKVVLGSEPVLCSQLDRNVHVFALTVSVQIAKLQRGGG
jgi:hypothetical protein